MPQPENQESPTSSSAVPEISHCIVIIDDEEESLAAMTRALSKVGYTTITYEDGATALEHPVDLQRADLVITDLKMPGVDGLTVLQKVKELNPETGVLIVTAYGTVETAVSAMQLGADDFVVKPLDLFELRHRVRHILERHELANEVRRLRQRLDERFGFGSIISKSAAMQRVFEQVLAVAPTKSTVLITGESGTGKELIANAVHQNSPRRAGRFMPLHCAALAPSLLESELFGHEKGAFTGATDRRIGRLEIANGGTIFLDEIGEMSADVQVKLLRFLELREITRVGGTETITLDVRLLAATHRDLAQAVEDGKFRSDLFYRLKVISLHLPPLRERKEDIPLLIHEFIRHFNTEHGKSVERLSAEALDVMLRHEWPGNVRELRNVIENLVVFSRSGEIDVDDLPTELFAVEKQSVSSLGAMPMAELERRAILEALQRNGGNRLQTALDLGIGLRTLQRKLKEYGTVKI
jgi:two-component system, NtrC family, response regulator AtoC